MLLTEIKIGGVYSASLNVEFRTKEIQEVELMVRVVGITQKGVIEVIMLPSPDNAYYYLNPSQLNPLG